MNATMTTKRAAANAEPELNGDGPHTLSSYIQSRFDECSRSQKDVAQYIIDHLDEGCLPDCRGTRAAREHLELDRRALLAGARL